MSQSKKLLIDQRTAEDFLSDIENKAKFYTPEWSVDKDNPDIGYAIARVFANQMEENIESLNGVLENYHVEFINMLDISPKSARPAEGLIEFTMGIDTIPGTYIPRGTKLRTDEEDPIIFETQNSIYVTGSSLVACFMVDGEDGYIRPIKGRFVAPSLISTVETQIEDELETEEEESLKIYNEKEFKLFGEDFTISQNSAYFYQKSIFDTGENPILVRIEGNEDIKTNILSGKFVFKWYSDKGLIPFVETKLSEDGDFFILIRDGEHEIASVSVNGEEYNLVVLEAATPIRENMPVKKVTFSSSGDYCPIDFVTDGNTEFNRDKFQPFGEELNPYTQCFIGMDKYFGKEGARIDISFDVTYGVHEYTVALYTADDPELKVIKKKPRVRAVDIPADCVVNEISFEYFNGSGWKTLNCSTQTTGLFEEKNPGKYKLSFIAPSDWAPNDVGAYNGRMIRMQILRADNSYYRPCTHYYPIISRFKVAYSYEDKYIAPLKLKVISGTKVYDLTKEVFESRKYNLFSSTEYFYDALFLGFSKNFENGPISLLFDIDERFDTYPLKYVFEYSSSTGFKQMKVLDSTFGMTRTGTVTFLPMPDMVRTTVEGKNMYWIRLVRTKTMEEDRKHLPVIKDIRPNVVRVANVDRQEEEEIYIDAVTPGQVIELYQRDILDVEVWVNELNYASIYEIERLKIDSPNDIQTEYDRDGNMTRCFIRYEECNSLQLSEKKRVYVLDRINGRIMFGDGVKTFIPRVLNDVALKYRIRKSKGSKANVDPDTITQSVGNLVYIDEIRNPFRIFNGSDMEDTESVLKRGSLLIQAKKRLLSVDDYKREIIHYTDAVKDMEVVCELLKDNTTDPLAVSLVLLLNDYNIGSGAFDRIASGIKAHILERCELTVNENSLRIVEPIFVDVSVDIWAESSEIDDSFELQNILREDLEEYLNPLNGWKIGTIPRVSQIMMRLNVLKNKAIIKKTTITAKYTDMQGEHEVNINSLKVTPYMICRSGNHTVHVNMGRG